jgi:hypothetical protein
MRSWNNPLSYRLLHGWQPSRQEMAQMSPAELLELFKCADDLRLWVEGQIIAEMIERDDAVRERVQAFVRLCQAEIEKERGTIEPPARIPPAAI